MFLYKRAEGGVRRTASNKNMERDLLFESTRRKGEKSPQRGGRNATVRKETERRDVEKKGGNAPKKEASRTKGERCYKKTFGRQKRTDD